MSDSKKLDRYAVTVGNRRGSSVTEMLLSPDDAKARGLTDADKVSSRKAAAKPSNKAAASKPSTKAAAPAAAPSK
jgi:hypothetical protein